MTLTQLQEITVEEFMGWVAYLKITEEKVKNSG